MPYLITTKFDADLIPPERQVTKSRRAVATLDEAREHAFTATAKVPRYVLGEAARISDSIYNLPEQGGTIGPLPDGTVIEVERVEWARLSRLAESDTDDHAGILSAYNAAQRRTDR